MIAFLEMLWGARKYTLPALAIIAICAFAFLAHYRLAELHAADCGRGIAEQQLQATQRVTTAKIEAMQQTMEQTHERDDFETKATQAINTDRGGTLDGVLAPVLRDALERLRARQGAH